MLLGTVCGMDRTLLSAEQQLTICSIINNNNNSRVELNIYSIWLLNRLRFIWFVRHENKINEQSSLNDEMQKMLFSGQFTTEQLHQHKHQHQHQNQHQSQHQLQHIKSIYVFTHFYVMKSQMLTLVAVCSWWHKQQRTEH